MNVQWESTPALLVVECRCKWTRNQSCNDCILWLEKVQKINFVQHYISNTHTHTQTHKHTQTHTRTIHMRTPYTHTRTHNVLTTSLLPLAVGFQPEVTNKVHHLLLFGCDEPYSRDSHWDCKSMFGLCARSPGQIMYAWANHAKGLELPQGRRSIYYYLFAVTLQYFTFED